MKTLIIPDTSWPNDLIFDWKHFWGDPLRFLNRKLMHVNLERRDTVEIIMILLQTNYQINLTFTSLDIFDKLTDVQTHRVAKKVTFPW